MGTTHAIRATDSRGVERVIASVPDSQVEEVVRNIERLLASYGVDAHVWDEASPTQ